MKRFSSVILAFLFALFLTGCWDMVEIEDRAFVVSVGIDKDGKTGGYTADAEIADVNAKTEMIKHGAGQTVPDAFHEIDTRLGRKLYFGQLKLVLLGKDLLADENLFQGCADALADDPEISRKVMVLAVNGDAKEILEAENAEELLTGVFVDKFFKNNGATTTFRADVNDLARSLHVDGSAVIPQISVENGELKLGGAAVIKEYKLCGWLNDEEVRGY